MAISGSVELDLNGYVLRYENTQAYGSVLKVESGGSLTIKDSNPSSPHKFKPNDDGLWVLDENGTETVSGGIITGGTGTLVDIYQYQTFGGGVYVSGGKLTMEGGNIVGCRAVRNGRPAFGGGVYLCSDNVAGMASSFVMNGGGIVGCASVDCGGGVFVEPMCEFVMNSGSEIRACVTRNGGGVYINSSGNATGKLTLNGGKILSCKAVISTPVAGRGGGVYNEGQFTMNSGGIEKCTSADGESDGVWNSGEFSKNGGTIDGNVAGGGTISLTVGVSGEDDFLAALENKNVTTIKLKGDITVSEGVALTIDRPITIVNGSGNAGTLSLYCPLTITEGGTLTLQDNAHLYLFGNVTVKGGLTVGATCDVLFGDDNTSLTISDGGKVTTCAAEEGKTSGLLSLDKGTKLAIAANGKMDNQGVLSISDIENLRKAAEIGGDLRLNRMTITEDYDLDMKGRLLTISDFLNFEPDANLTVKNASKVDARGTEISGGSYYCPVDAEMSLSTEKAITGGSFYGPVTVRSQSGTGGLTPSSISGGTFYDKLEGAYSIKGHTVTFMNDGSRYAMQVVPKNGKATAPDALSKDGYTFAGWYTEDGKKFDFGNDIVTGDIALAAQWTSNGSDWSPSYAVVVPDDPSHGSVAVSAKYAYRGSTVTVTVAPDAGYVLETLTATDARGNELALTDRGNGAFTFIMPGSRVEVRASFMEDNSLLNLFYDVPNDAYYYEAVKWAAASGIAQGYGNGLFGPDDPCTRGQVVTFLWRAAGCPEPSAPSSFSDVSQDAYYAKAVAWAVEAGIAHGYSSDAFGPDDICTRGQVATFLWRAAGSPESAASSGFADVAEGAYYADAVAWAAENGIAHGYDNGSFGPDDGCTRGQAVTFLWRANS